MYVSSIRLKIYESTRRLLNRDVNVLSVPLHYVTLAQLRKSFRNIVKYSFSLLVYLLLLFIAVVKSIKASGAKLILASNAPDLTGVICALVNILTFGKVQYIYELRELTPELYTVRASMSSTLYKLLLFLEKIATSRSSYIITVSNAMKSLLLKRYYRDPVRIVTIYPALNTDIVDLKDILKEKRNIKRRHDKIVAVYGGSYQEQIHDFETLFKAISMLKGYSIKIKIIGKGEPKYRQKLLDIVKRCNLKEIVEFRPLMPKEEYLKILSQADIAFIPLKRNMLTMIAVPNKFTEYCALDKHIIAPKLLGIIEVKREYNKIYIYEPENPLSLKNAILKCIKDIENNTSYPTRLNVTYTWRYERIKFLNIINKFLN